jgi:transposase
MSMYPQKPSEIPEETVRVARAAFPKGTLAMRLRDELGALYHDESFAALYPQRGQPAYAPWRLAVGTILQYADNLTDRQAADAVRARIDWKYCLGLELTDEGFDFSLLSEFRQRLVEEDADRLLLDRLLDICQQRGWLKAGGKQRTDSTQVLARVRSLSNLECVGETLRAALNELAEREPEWLLRQVNPGWFERYSHRVENYRLPKAESQRTALAQQIGADGLHVLQALDAPNTPAGLAQLPSVQVLRRVWSQYYELSRGQANWRAGPQAEAGEGVVRSPYDPEAQTGKKRETVWLGYKVHLTETCDPSDDGEQAMVSPHLIVDVQTTVAPLTDWEMTAVIQERLMERELKPAEHLVDTGYVTAEHLVRDQQHHIHLVGPVMPDTSWQAKERKGFDAASFQIDWQAKQALCPQGQTSHSWWKEGDSFKVKFPPASCAACPVRADCTDATSGGRSLKLLPQAAQQALQERRQEQATPAFHEQYATRSGIEATLSQAVRRSGLRRARYDGLAKVQVQHVCTAVAVNVVRLDAWFTQTPLGQTRVSHFARLAQRLSSLPSEAA